MKLFLEELSAEVESQLERYLREAAQEYREDPFETVFSGGYLRTCTRTYYGKGWVLSWVTMASKFFDTEIIKNEVTYAGSDDVAEHFKPYITIAQ